MSIIKTMFEETGVTKAELINILQTKVLDDKAKKMAKAYVKQESN